MSVTQRLWLRTRANEQRSSCHTYMGFYTYSDHSLNRKGGSSVRHWLYCTYCSASLRTEAVYIKPPSFEVFGKISAAKDLDMVLALDRISLLIMMVEYLHLFFVSVCIGKLVCTTVPTWVIVPSSPILIP